MVQLVTKERKLWILLAAYAAYAAAFIAKSSFVVDGVRYFALFDDAMISMTYARTFAQGHGLVWFPGAERVEGFTNPLWVAFMAFWHLLPIAQSKISLAVQISGAVFVLGAVYFTHRIADALRGRRWRLGRPHFSPRFITRSPIGACWAWK
jgi:hypothetical protein